MAPASYKVSWDGWTHKPGQVGLLEEVHYYNFNPDKGGLSKYNLQSLSCGSKCSDGLENLKSELYIKDGPDC